MRQKSVSSTKRPILHCFTMGVPRLLLGNQTIDKALSRKARALLFYLVVTAQTHARDSLTTLLWPEMSDRQARKNLRTVLPELRKVLAEQIEITTESVALAPQSYWSDIDAFRAALTAKESSAQKLATLQQALDLYQGEFLQGFHVRNAAPFEDWMISERERLRLLLIEGLSELADHALAAQDYKIGIAAARRLVTVEPWLEHGHAQLMRLLLHSGQRTEALQQFELCRRLLEQEFGVEPGPAIRALAQSIRKPGANPDASAQPSAVQSLPTKTSGDTKNNPSADTRQPVPNVIPNNLITPLAPFIGRAKELAFICQKVVDPECRLLTIIGPGGMGKTSLAQRTAHRLLRDSSAHFPDGIYFVALAGIGVQAEATGEQWQESSAPIFTAIANQIGCELQTGVPSQEQVQRYLQQRQMLLILDNFEHLLTEMDAVVTLLTHVPSLTVIVTSRVRFNVRGEVVLTLKELSLPVRHPSVQWAPPNHSSAEPRERNGTASEWVGRDPAWQSSEAVTLFVQLAQYIHPDFTVKDNLDAVVRISQAVEGLPLGLELAAGMLSMVSCRELADELDHGLDVLQAELQDLPQEQRTLRAVFERSWQLLNHEEGTLLLKLALFPAPFHRHAAQTVADASLPLLTRLVNQSLLTHSGHGRYTMHRTIRDFALAKLEERPTLLAAMRTRYTDFYLDFLARQESALYGKTHAAATTQIYLELDHLRCAWQWAVQAQRADILGRALHAFFLFCESQGLYTEGFNCCEHALHRFAGNDATVPHATVPHATQAEHDPALTLLIGQLQTYVGFFLARLGRMGQAEAALRTGESLLRPANSRFALTFCLAILGSLLRVTDPEQSKRYLTEAVQLADAGNSEWLETLVVLLLGDTYYLAGDYVEAEALYTRGYDLSQRLQWGWGLISSTRSLGRLNLALGTYQTAEDLLRRSLLLAQQEKQRNAYLEATLFLGETLRLQGRYTEAHYCFVESYHLATTSQFKLMISHALWAQGTLAEQRGDYGEAKALFEECLTTVHPNLWGQVLPTYGWTLIGLGELAAARHYFAEVLAKAEDHQRTPIALDAQVGLVIIEALGAQAADPTDATLPQSTRQLLDSIETNPAATQETRDRIATLERFGLR